jgi:hypothetical protein
VQNIRIYAAPSLSEVIKQLFLYRSTGVLTIWRAVDARQEDTRISIELGRPIIVYRGLHWENATVSILAWLNSWGEIHFVFQPTEARLGLPSPQPAPLVDQDNSPSAPTQFTLSQQKPLSTTQPLKALSANNRSVHSSSPYTNNQHGKASPSANGQTREPTFPPDLPQYQVIQQPSFSASNPQASASESAIASLTNYGIDYAAANLPRYDRIIFLLINGKRTLSDLSQLTKRPHEEILATLQRLENLQLITIVGATQESP